MTYTAKVVQVDTVEPLPARPWPGRLGIWTFFVLITVVMTWPLGRVLGSRSYEHADVFFNIWRLGWVSHALTTAPATLFDANQFYPERLILAYSDAMLIEGLVALPLFAAGLPPTLIHNLLLLGAIATSGIGMFTLARHVCKNDAAAVLAGLVFAFAPYRFAHFMHMELQWAMWIPWAFWSLQRTFETGRAAFGLLTGVFIALQIGSSIYYGIFLALLMCAAGAVQLLRVPRARRLRVIGALTAGAAIAIAVAVVYSKPYREATGRVGVRSLPEIQRNSATPSSYLLVSEGNRLYGPQRAGPPELALFPGWTPILLAAAGLILVRPSTFVVSYTIGLLLAFDLSLGLNGVAYPYLQQHVTVFKGLRAPARAAIFFLMFLGALAALGWRALQDRLPARARLALTVVVAGVMLAEYWVAPLRLWPYPNRPPLYEFLARQPDGVVAEFPVPRLEQLPAHDARYAYMSIFHWKRLVNGYSGYYPPSYIRRMERLATFPDAGSLDQLRADGVRYVVVHEGSYIRRGEAAGIVLTLTREGLRPLTRLHDGWAAATIFELSGQ